MAVADKVWIWSERIDSERFDSGSWEEYWDVGSHNFVRASDGHKVSVGWSSKHIISFVRPNHPPSTPVGDKIFYRWKVSAVIDFTMYQHNKDGMVELLRKLKLS